MSDLMLFNADEIYEEYSAPKAGKIPVGIHQAVKVVSVEADKDYIVDINFEDAQGRKQNKRLWYPKGNYPDKEKGETPEQAKNREARQNLAHLTRLLHIFDGPDSLKKFPKGLNYESFIDEAIKVLKPKLSKKTINLKVLYDKDGVYTEIFGKFPSYMEEHIPGQEPTIEISEWEQKNRMTHKAPARAEAQPDVPKQNFDDLL